MLTLLVHRRWALTRRQALDRLPAGVLPAGTGALAPVPAALARRAADLRSAPASCRSSASIAGLADARRVPGPGSHRCASASGWSTPSGRLPAPAVLAYLSRYTHRVAISNSRLIALDGRGVRFRWKDYRAKGSTRYKPMTLEPRRVYAPLPFARAARRLSSHSPLRAAGQRQPQGQAGRGRATVAGGARGISGERRRRRRTCAAPRVRLRALRARDDHCCGPSRAPHDPAHRQRHDQASNVTARATPPKRRAAAIEQCQPAHLRTASSVAAVPGLPRPMHHGTRTARCCRTTCDAHIHRARTHCHRLTAARISIASVPRTTTVTFAAVSSLEGCEDTCPQVVAVPRSAAVRGQVSHNP